MLCLRLQATARLKEKCGKTQQARQAYRRGIVVNPEHGPAYVVSHDETAHASSLPLHATFVTVVVCCCLFDLCLLGSGTSILHVSSCCVGNLMCLTLPLMACLVAAYEPNAACFMNLNPAYSQASSAYPVGLLRIHYFRVCPSQLDVMACWSLLQSH